jgi:hypothetical protein
MKTYTYVEDLCQKYKINRARLVGTTLVGRSGSLFMHDYRLILSFHDFASHPPLTDCKRRFAIRSLHRAGLVPGSVRLVGDYAFTCEIEESAVRFGLGLIGALPLGMHCRHVRGGKPLSEVITAETYQSPAPRKVFCIAA